MNQLISNGVNLEKLAGLPVELDGNKLKFNPPLIPVVPNIRTLAEVRPVMMNPEAKVDLEEMYYMYRDVHMPTDEELIRKHHLRYDITVLPPAMLGEEFNKTVGHYHENKPGSEIAYPEIYEVLHGEALFLIQKMDKDFKNIISIIAIKGSAGEKIIYPPNYGHVLINIGYDVLVTANWAGDNFKSLYEPVAAYHGLGYYAVSNRKGGYEFVENTRYKNIPEIRVLTHKFMGNFEIMKSGPMYPAGVEKPQNLEFLTSPEKYALELSSITS